MRTASFPFLSLTLALLILAACASLQEGAPQPRPPMSAPATPAPAPPAAPEQPAPEVRTQSYLLTEGEPVRLFTNQTLRFELENGSALFLLDDDQFTLPEHGNGTTAGVTLRLDTLLPDAVTQPKQGIAEFSFATSRVQVRDTLTEGSTGHYRGQNVSVNVTLLLVGTDATGQTVAKFAVDGKELRPLAEKEDAFLGDGYLFALHLYPARPGSLLRLAQANVTVIAS
jgi:hypothetical protein